MTTTANRPDPRTFTPERIVAAARSHSLALVPGTDFTTTGHAITGCCAMTALAIDLDERVAEGKIRPAYVFREAGLTTEFRVGIQNGFDRGYPVKCPPHDDYTWGYALGLRVRAMAGVDAP